MKMNIYTSTINGEKIDLDDIDVYEDVWKQMDISELFSSAWTAAGQSLFYMNYMDTDMKHSAQSLRVHDLCKELVGWNGKKRYEEADRLELMSWLYRFNDEVENQC